MMAAGEDWKKVSAADSFAAKRPNTLLCKERSLKSPSESPQNSIKIKVISLLQNNPYIKGRRHLPESI